MYLLALIVGTGVILLMGYALLTRRKLRPVQFELVGLVPAAVIPQLLAFYFPVTRAWVPDLLTPVILVWSQLVLLGFVWINWKRPGMWLLGLGLVMNFLVILANGGMMPVTPATASELSAIESWDAGVRFGLGKGVVLHSGTTAFWSLSDRFLLPKWIPYQAAYSLGDVFIVAGALVLLRAMSSGKRTTKPKQQMHRTMVAIQPPAEYDPNHRRLAAYE